MAISSSVLEDLLDQLPHLRSQLYFKSSLTALSHAMEDQVLATGGSPLVIASFQKERFYRQEAHRYRRIAHLTPQVYVLAAPETSFMEAEEDYETVPFEPQDALSQEWHLVVIGPTYSTCLVCRERSPLSHEIQAAQAGNGSTAMSMDHSRRFEGIWTFERDVSIRAATILLDRIQRYRPDLVEKINEAKAYLGSPESRAVEVAPDPFVQRLITHLQAGQYKLLKAYRSISSQERRERLVNSVTAAFRESLDPDEIFRVAVDQLRASIDVCRCIVYRCKTNDSVATVAHEARREPSILSLKGETWPLEKNPLFQQVAETQETVAIANTSAPSTPDLSPLADLIRDWHIQSWLVVPVIYQGTLLGMVELHHCAARPYDWTEEDQALVEAIANQLGVALIQAEAYANLEDLNTQLADLENTRSNLIAITGHELRTPLSTIQVCLESLSSEPDMPVELRQVMLTTALSDADRMRKLVQDFITLSKLESGRVEWRVEPLAIGECVSLALSSLRTRQSDEEMPTIKTQVSDTLPLVRADGERLVEVLSKLLDNACKFTDSDGNVVVEAQPADDRMLQVTISDTGRGIEPSRLEAVFDRFYQEEGALRRTTSGTGLGLAICRQIIEGLGGQIWAESEGRDRGSRFHFTVPMASESTRSDADSSPVPVSATASSSNRRSRSKSR